MTLVSLPFTKKFRKFRLECKWEGWFLFPKRKVSGENGIFWKVVQNSQTENVLSIYCFLTVFYQFQVLRQ